MIIFVFKEAFLMNDAVQDDLSDMSTYSSEAVSLLKPLFTVQNGAPKGCVSVYYLPILFHPLAIVLCSSVHSVKPSWDPHL